MYQERTYRELIRPEGLVCSRVTFKESDLCVYAAGDVTARAVDLVSEARLKLEGYIDRDAEFAASLVPHEVLNETPELARRMAAAAARFGVGPMAAVAGAVAEYVGDGIEGDVIVENGGDIYARSQRPLTVNLHAGECSPFAGRVKFLVRTGGRPVGICTSSGTFGHSRSFGSADVVCVISRSAAIADAAATALCNKVKGPDDVDAVIEEAKGCEEIDGIIIAAGDKLGAWGDIEFV